MVRRREATGAGREARKALRPLMDRGIPLKLMHLRPTSRISSAATTGSWLLDEGGDEDEDEDEEARAWRMGRPSGALRAKSAAAWKLVSEGWG